MIKLLALLQAHFNKMCSTGKLFRSSVDGDRIWNLYINSFSKENNPVFRDPESSLHNCNLCNNFIRRYGNIVAIVDNQIVSLFDIDAPEEYKESFEAISSEIKQADISEVFFETYSSLNSLPYESCSKSNDKFQLGMAKNVKRYTEEDEKYGVVEAGEIKTFRHLHLFVDSDFVDCSGDSVESIMADYRSAKNVFKRGMETISLDTLELVRDLIKQGSLLNGDAHIHKIEKMIPLKEEYDELPDNEKDNWCWVKSYGFKFAKFRNELIGVLCSELSEGEDLNKACQNWNKRVDPANYMKATAPITQSQINRAKEFVQENGYEESFDRRFAVLEDIKVSEILHSNAGDGTIESVSVFDNVKPTAKNSHRKSEFDGVEEVSIEKFMEDILPECDSVEAFLENRHEYNMVSLTTANNPNSKPIFKWDNNYSWTFNGNLAGKSQIKDQVKSKGGDVEGVLRFSMMWADGNKDNSDLDLHCIEPGGNHIYFSNKQNWRTKGNLDVDIRRPGGELAVENITFPSLSKMEDGTYKLFIRQYAFRNSKGFEAEIEFNGEIYSYKYDKPVQNKEDIQIAEVTLKDGKFSIEHKLTPSDGRGVSKEIYGLDTNKFHKVNLISLSPNHWDNNSVGNKHYLFMLEGCKTPYDTRSFHNENLLGDLLKHRKVMEVLGHETKLEPAEEQLSGIGFNATVDNSLIVKLTGSHKRVIKIKF